MYTWGKRSLERMQGVNELLQGVNELLIECAARALEISDHDMTIPWMGGKRSAENQNEIFKSGASTLDGFEKKSYHQTGNALDVIPVEGNYRNDKAFRHFAKCMFQAWQEMHMKGRIPDGLFLEWGGHWQNFIDVPHWQIVQR